MLDAGTEASACARNSTTSTSTYFHKVKTPIPQNLRLWEKQEESVAVFWWRGVAPTDFGLIFPNVVKRLHSEKSEAAVSTTIDFYSAAIRSRVDHSMTTTGLLHCGL